MAAGNCWPFCAARARAKADWEGLLQDLYRRGLEGKNLQLILTDGCAGLAAAIRTVYPRVRHQRCWVHKMRNILEKARKSRLRRSQERSPGDLSGRQPGRRPKRPSAVSAPAGNALSRRWCSGWQRDLAGVAVVLRLPPASVAQTAHHQRDRRCFVEVRRRTRPMVCFVNVESVDRIIYSIFQRFNLEWKTRTLNLFTQAA